MPIPAGLRATLLIAAASAAALASGCAKEQVSCLQLAHQHGTPSVLRHELLAEARRHPGHCQATQPK